MSEGKKKCFVITPIGGGNTEIRRHIDGIIDQAIVPAIGEKYEIEVAHRKYEIGSINDRVIESVYGAELVIANLTTLNPNVMYELAIRYSFGKPAIVIAEEGTKLPFDVIDENTIFYVNDPMGANDLKNKIIEFEKNINFDTQQGPIYKVIKNVPLFKEIESGEKISNDKLSMYIIEKLDAIERRINQNKTVSLKEITRLEIFCNIEGIENKVKFGGEMWSILKSYPICNFEFTSFGFIVYIDSRDATVILAIRKRIETFLEENGFKVFNIKKSYETIIDE